ncbi:MAG TPA: PEP-CTERM sorting domain-containing protein [Candidatus Limnocylindria bacterium]|jgi:hypothetical protein|nr:PEP-CTERM sorting domain-containing protein [Candidatus Limnocylindria bacterium]
MRSTPRLIASASGLYRTAILSSAAAGLLGLAGSVQAQLIPVPNGSFESPDASGSPTGVSTVIDSWTKLSQPGYFDPGVFLVDWNSVTGIFPNAPAPDPRHITNADGNQVGYFFAFPGAGVSQDLGGSFTAGLSYTLTFGLRGGGSLTAGTQFLAGLQYFNGTDWTTVGSTLVTATSDYGTTTSLNSITVNTGTIAGADAAVGKPIHVVLEATSFSGGSGLAYWEADNVTVTAVPEPESYALLAGLGLVGVAVWRRCRAVR